MADLAPKDPDFDRRLATLAELSVRIGVNLQPHQELIVSAPLEASGLARQIARSAYRHGAKSVVCLYEDPALILERLAESDADALDYSPEWMYRGIADGLRAGGARLQIVGPYPDLLSGVPTGRIVRAHRALARGSSEEGHLISSSAINWSIVPTVTDAPEEQARSRLWEALFDAARVTCREPRHAWDMHLRTLNARRDALQRRRFRSIRFFDGRTDLTVGLTEDHRWVGGSAVAANGIEGTRNIPTEEVFTALDGRLATGRVFFSRPLALGGTIVQNLYAEFENGTVAALKADRGLAVFERLIAHDEGSRRLGQVGLVPSSSRIARTGILFWNALFDRNAASHVAFGMKEDVARESSIHIDCMVGHDSMQVDGIAWGGAAMPIMRQGEFVI
jgi:aminopeptidase